MRTLALNMTAEGEDESRRLLAANVRELRAERGWTQERLAEEAGTSDQTIQNIEAQRGSARSSTIHRVATALGVEVGRLYRDPSRLQVAEPDAGYITDIPPALAELVKKQGKALNITKDEVAALLGYSFRGTPTVESYLFFLRAIRAAKK